MKSMQRRLLASYDVDSEKVNEGGAYRNTTVDRLGNPIPAIWTVEMKIHWTSCIVDTNRKTPILEEKATWMASLMSESV